MYIKEISKQNKKDGKTYLSHRLVESYRTKNGPRQRIVLQLGTLDIPSEKWKTLANRIEEIVSGQENLTKPESTIETLAVHYSQMIIKRELKENAEISAVSEGIPDYRKVDVNSVQTSHVRTIGAEYVCLNGFEKLKLGEILKETGFTENEIELATLSIIGRIAYPKSEIGTVEWGKQISGLDELIGTDFKKLGKNALYHIGLKLYEHKDKLEEKLYERVAGLFSLRRRIVLFDLTNTYFEGTGKWSNRAKYGVSKEKRNDCPLVTLGLVIDELGFPMASKVFDGNQRDDKSLKVMIEELSKSIPKDIKPTIIMDAGFSTKENLKFLKETEYDYIVVSRQKIEYDEESDPEEIVEIKEKDGNEVKARLMKRGEEHILYCESNMRREKEKGIKNRFCERFEAELEGIRESLKKPKGTKRYEKVMERIGRAREKNRWVSHFYKVEVEMDKKNGNAVNIKWEQDKELIEERFNGSYYLRTTRTDLDEKELWSLYITLTNIEDSFRAMKSELGMRPVYHKKDPGIEAHIFISVLAYHIMQTIRHQLRNKGIRIRWFRVRERLRSHVCVTTSMVDDAGKRVSIRNTSVPDFFVLSIYEALNLAPNPIKKIKTVSA